MPTIGPGIPGAALEAFAEGFLCGQAGTITITIDDGDGNNVVPTTTASIVEIECTGPPENAGVYRYLGVYPSDPALSPYLITWEGENLDGDVTTASEEILVSEEAPAPVSESGPCSDWTDGSEVAECCGDVVYSSDTADDLNDAASLASAVLYAISGRQFSGLCGPITVRPCRDECQCFPAQRLAYPDGSSRLLWTGYLWTNGIDTCGCGCLSRVLLDGYPVQAISQVKIDGDIVAPSAYRLDEKRYLIRKDGAFWPSCQDLSRDDDEAGTFSISYWFGATPDIVAIEAAKALACEFYRACAGGECKLPSGATRIIRQGVTIERVSSLSAMLLKGETGILAVDGFLAAYGGVRRRPVFWSPDGPQYARRVGA